MFVTPNFTINSSPNEHLISLSQNEDGEINEYYLLDSRKKIIGLKLPKIHKELILTPIGNDKALYLLSDGTMKIDFIKA